MLRMCFFWCVCVSCYPVVRGRWGQLAGWSCSPQSESAQEETGEGPALESTEERERHRESQHGRAFGLSSKNLFPESRVTEVNPSFSVENRSFEAAFYTSNAGLNF